MSHYGKIHEKHLRALAKAEIRGDPDALWAWQAVCDEVARLGRKKVKQAPRKKAQREKRADKNAKTAWIRNLVYQRSGGICECGCRQPLPPDWEMDHFWGRGKAPQADHNCWALTPGCHRAKTHNRPDAISWVRAYYNHALQRGYGAEAARTGHRIAALEAASTLDDMRKAGT